MVEMLEARNREGFEVTQVADTDTALSLLDTARTPRDRCLLALAMNLGLRGSEIARLQWRDVNWTDETIRVHVDKTNEVDDMPISRDLLDEPIDRSAEVAVSNVSPYAVPFSMSSRPNPSGVS